MHSDWDPDILDCLTSAPLGGGRSLGQWGQGCRGGQQAGPLFLVASAFPVPLLCLRSSCIPKPGPGAGALAPGAASPADFSPVPGAASE